jgi:hypothetical protein
VTRILYFQPRTAARNGIKDFQFRIVNATVTERDKLGVHGVRCAAACSASAPATRLRGASSLKPRDTIRAESFRTDR